MRVVGTGADGTQWTLFDGPGGVALGLQLMDEPREPAVPLWWFPRHLTALDIDLRSDVRAWQSTQLLARLNAARTAGLQVTADIYPYTDWQAGMTVLFPERNFRDRAAAEFARARTLSKSISSVRGSSS